MNIVLDLYFVRDLGLGVAGVAWATIIAQACSAVWVLRFLTGKQAILKLRLRYMALELKRVKAIISLGLSGFFMNLTTSLVQVVCNATLQAYGGDLYVSVMTIINSLREVFFMPVQGLTNGAQPVTGYNYGAGQYSRVRSSIRFSTTVTVVYAAVFWAAAMAFPGLLIQVFSSEPEVIEAGIPALRIYFLLFVFMSLQMAGQGVFVGLGRSRQAIFFSLLRKAVINAPLTVILPIWMGTTGVFVAEAVSQLIGGLACILTMYFTVYRPPAPLAQPRPQRIQIRDKALQPLVSRQDGGHHADAQRLPGQAGLPADRLRVGPRLQRRAKILPRQAAALRQLRQDGRVPDVPLLHEVGPEHRPVKRLSPAPLLSEAPALKGQVRVRPGDDPGRQVHLHPLGLTGGPQRLGVSGPADRVVPDIHPGLRRLCQLEGHMGDLRRFLQPVQQRLQPVAVGADKIRDDGELPWHGAPSFQMRRTDATAGLSPGSAPGPP